MALDQEEKQERDYHGCSPRQSQGSGLPACAKSGGLFQLITLQKSPSSLPILGQHLPSYFCPQAGGDSGDLARLGPGMRD